MLVAPGTFEFRDELLRVPLFEDDARPADEVDRKDRAFQYEMSDVCRVDVNVFELYEHVPCLRAGSACPDTSHTGEGRTTLFNDTTSPKGGSDRRSCKKSCGSGLGPVHLDRGNPAQSFEDP